MIIIRKYKRRINRKHKRKYKRKIWGRAVFGDAFRTLGSFGKLYYKALGEKWRKENYAMVKLNVPKRVTLPNGRTFIARYKRIKRSEYHQILLWEELIHKGLCQEVEGVGEHNKAREFLTL